MENNKLKFVLLAGLISLSYATHVDKNGNLFVFGEDNEVNGKHNVFDGNRNVVKGNSNMIIGDGNVIDGGSNFVKGQNNLVIGGENFISGSGNIIEDFNAFVMGDNKIQTSTSINEDSFLDIEELTSKMQKEMQERLKNMESMMNQNFRNHKMRIENEI